LFINFHLSAIASRSGEAGGEEIDESQSTFGGGKSSTAAAVSFVNIST
jgi:hypothetical protein